MNLFSRPGARACKSLRAGAVSPQDSTNGTAVSRRWQPQDLPALVLAHWHDVGLSWTFARAAVPTGSDRETVQSSEEGVTNASVRGRQDHMSGLEGTHRASERPVVLLS